MPATEAVLACYKYTSCACYSSRAGKLQIDLVCLLHEPCWHVPNTPSVPATGAVLLQILENGVSQYPKLEGRFPQVAGVQFKFDPLLSPGSRVIRDLVRVGDEPLVDEQTYRLCTKAYMRLGRDGYSMLTNCPVLVSCVALDES